MSSRTQAGRPRERNWRQLVKAAAKTPPRTRKFVRKSFLTAPEFRPDVNPYDLYNKRAGENDRKFVKECYESMDTMLVFAGIFSAAIAQFISSTTNLLSNGPDRTNQLLQAVVNLLDQKPYTQPDDFVPSRISIAINCLFFASLILSLLSALVALLVKQYVRHYELRTASSQWLPWTQARARESRRASVEGWYLQTIISFTPILIHIALALFLAGVALWVVQLNNVGYGPIFGVTISTAGLGAIGYLLLASLSLFRVDTPFHGPVTSTIRQAFLALKGRATPQERVEYSSLDEKEEEGPVAPSSDAKEKKEMGNFNRWLRLFVGRPKSAHVDQSQSTAEEGRRVVEAFEDQTALPQQEGTSKGFRTWLKSLPSTMRGLDTRQHQEGPPSSDESDEEDYEAIKLNFYLTPHAKIPPSIGHGLPKRYQLTDAFILLKVMRQASTLSEVEAAIDLILEVDWRDLDLTPALLVDGETVLQRCRELAETCCLHENLPQLLPDGRDRARRVCLFIEWFYVRLTPAQRHQLTGWPDAVVAKALRYEYKPGLIQPSISDKMVAYSAIQKLHHVKLAPGQRCLNCFTLNPIDREEDVRAQIHARRPLVVAEDGCTDDDVLEQVKEVQDLLAARCSTDVDCLLHYLGDLRTYPDIVERLRASVEEWVPTLGIWSNPYATLTTESHRDTQRLVWTAGEHIRRADATDYRIQWCTELLEQCEKA